MVSSFNISGFLVCINPKQVPRILEMAEWKKRRKDGWKKAQTEQQGHLLRQRKYASISPQAQLSRKKCNFQKPSNRLSPFLNRISN